MKQIKRFELRLSELEAIQLKENASMSGLTISEYIRKRAVYSRDFIVDLSPILKLNYEISKIGININQIVKLCNYHKFVGKKDVDTLINLQKEIKELLQPISSFCSEIKNLEK